MERKPNFYFWQEFFSLVDSFTSFRINFIAFAKRKILSQSHFIHNWVSEFLFCNEINYLNAFDGIRVPNQFATDTVRVGRVFKTFLSIFDLFFTQFCPQLIKRKAGFCFMRPGFLQFDLLRSLKNFHGAIRIWWFFIT